MQSSIVRGAVWLGIYLFFVLGPLLAMLLGDLPRPRDFWIELSAALGYTGLKQDDLGWIELNEAFAAQSLAVINTLGLNPAVVNPMGGAIALGHPLGATGAIRAATTVHALRRRNLKYGMVTMCVGTGMGAAGIFERM